MKNSVSNKLSLLTKQISFTHLSFNRSGDRFLACDLQGSIFMFDLTYNRFLRLNRLGITCTGLSYNLKCKTEYLVACIDGTIKCFNTETKDLVGWMKGHEKPILGLSVHPTNGDMVLSFSCDLAQLWDLKTFECKQKLNINSKKNVEIVKICFAPSTNDIISLFKDDTIYIWSSENISLKCQFNVYENNENNNQTYEQTPIHFYKCLSISSDGKTLITGSRNNYLHIWSVEKKELIKKIELNQKQDKSLGLKDCLFIPGAFYENRLVIVLTQEGDLDVYNIENSQLVANLNSFKINNNQSQILNHQKPIQIYCSSNARYFCSVTDDGCIQCYDLDHSPLKSLKVSANIMKYSSINSTNNRTSNSDIDKKKQKMLTDNNIQLKKISHLNSLENKVESKLFKILKCFNEYPARYRMFIWKIILKLPENYDSYAFFIKAGMHPAFTKLASRYPLKSQKSIRLLQW